MVGEKDKWNKMQQPAATKAQKPIWSRCLLILNCLSYGTLITDIFPATFSGQTVYAFK